jgi:hypothetical protein
MATINMSFDTKTKKLDVSINGVTIANVNHVSVYRSHDELDEQQYVEVSVESSQVHVEDDMVSRVVFVSHGSVKGQKALASGSYVEDDRFPGLIGVPDVDPVIAEVDNYFNQS